MTHIGDDPDHFGWGRSASRSTDRHDPAFLDVFDTFWNEGYSARAMGESLPLKRSEVVDMLASGQKARTHNYIFS